MHTSKLIQVLKSFTKEELRDFEQFLSSPVFNYGAGKQQNIALFKALSEYYPGFKAAKIKKELVFATVYPESEYKVGKLEKQMSRIFKLLEQFVVFRHSGIEKENQQLLALSTFYHKKKLHKLAEKSIQKLRDFMDKNDQRDSDYYYDAFFLEKQITNNQIFFPKSKNVINIPLTLESLDNYYVLAKLELACQLLALNLFSLPIEFGKSMTLIDTLNPLLEADHFDIPVIRAYYKAYRLLKSYSEDSEAYFLDLEQELKQNSKEISKEQLKALNTMLRNYCLTQTYKGRKGFLKRTFNLYQQHLEEGQLYYEGKILATVMRNIVVFGLRLKEFDWVWQFINEHKNKIAGINSPQNAYSLNLANYYFYLKDYKKALGYLSDNYEDNYYKLNAKRMEIMSYYEMKSVLFESKVEAFKIYIYRLPEKSITQKYKKANNNFIDLLKQICHPSTYKNDKRINKLFSKIESIKWVAEKEWLKEKLEALK